MTRAASFLVTISAAAAAYVSTATFASAQHGAHLDPSKIVRECVQVVHATKVTKDEAYMLHFYQGFDAFYNAATETIQNNATSVGDQKALFIFQKCMAERGMPLGPVSGLK